MELTQKTKVAEMLAAYPFLKDFLVRLNPHYKGLDNPVMRNTIGRVATLGQAALMGGMQPEEFIGLLAREIKEKTGGEVRVVDAAQTSLDRQEILKGIIKDLHAGADVEVLKKRFLELIKDVSPSEIASMEQRLMDEGMPEEEVKRLCSVHVEVFRESLETQAVPGLPGGHPVHTFMLENRHLEGLLHEFAEAKDAARLAALLKRMREVEKHYLRKENQLFPILEAKGMSGPSKVMWAVHDDIRAEMKESYNRLKKGEVDKASLGMLSAMMSDMIYKEEHILFPMAIDTLSDDDWAKVKKGEEEIGFAWIAHVDAMGPPAGQPAHDVQAGPVGGVTLGTGMLTGEQVDLMLRHLPVDISFVDENDEVAYYSNTPERIFPRSPGVIGRKVINCHPPRSVATVQKIVESFRDGSKDSAEFYITMGGRFIHIRYFAVRDDAGAYRGTLEVSQDVTDIRALTGEKRLLDWE